MALVFLAFPDGQLHIAYIIERIENTEYVHTVFMGEADEFFNYIIRIMPIADQVLAAQQHLKLGVFDPGANIFEAFPGIFIQIADARIKGGAAPHFQREKAHSVHFFDDGEHIPRPHPGSNERLMRIAQSSVSYFYSHIDPQRFYIKRARPVPKGPTRL
jgi:hypothetical protein